MTKKKKRTHHGQLDLGQSVLCRIPVYTVTPTTFYFIGSSQLNF